MVLRDQQRNRHFILANVAQTEPFRSPQQGGGRTSIPPRNRRQHGRALLSQIEALKPDFETAATTQSAAGLDSGLGLSVEFQSFPDIELAFESLARERSGIELLNVRHADQHTYATVFVPDGKLAHFESLIRAYLEERKDSIGRPRDNRNLVDAIQEVRAASLRALWTDDANVFPTANEGALWWEVWLPVRGDRSGSLESFHALAQAQGLEVATGELIFPERTVLIVHGSLAQMTRSMMTLNSVAELRRAKETAEFFDSLQAEEQAAWLDELLARTSPVAPGRDVPYVCLLDTGVNNGHPLLARSISDPDLHTIWPTWGTADADGHGTQMAGLALAGDLTNALESPARIDIGHRLESVKLLQSDSTNGNDARHHGYLTTEAVLRPEVTEPGRHRVFGMAVTAKDNRDRGRPSAWSAAIDRLAADAEGQGASPRLFVISAGNTDPNNYMDYPSSNSLDSVHDPAQAWNALTVGGFTNLCEIAEPYSGNHQPVAQPGGLSPVSTTSGTWNNNWPLKPDVLFEGGNVAHDSIGAVSTQSLSLLTTHHLLSDRLFTTIIGTSAATALAARMAAQLMAVYPALRPESIRALIVHSAEWTAAMRQMFLPADHTPSKRDYATLVRHCGFGVPDLDRALWSVANSLTMVVEEQLHPYKRETGKDPALRDMHLYRLPWPLAELEALGETPVEMRATLSYFIEPNPSQRGFASRYRYQSHGLRFDVKRPLESEDDFRARINVAARDEEEHTATGGDDPGWLIGKSNRGKGSLHSDIWRGSAADLASRGMLAVYPALGWWKTRPRLARYDTPALYSLIVSIRAPAVDVDLYSAVAIQIATAVAVKP